MRVKVKWQDVIKAFEATECRDTIVELDAEPIEERTEWEKKLEQIPQNNYYQVTDYVSPDGESSYKKKIIDFIRTEIIRTFADQCIENIYKEIRKGRNGHSVSAIEAVVAKWLGGSK